MEQPKKSKVAEKLKEKKQVKATPSIAVEAEFFYVTPDKVTDEHLNSAARMLLEQIPEHAYELMHVLCDENQVPMWHVVAGQLLAAHLDGRLSAFQLDPAWRQGLRQQVLVCKLCEKEFKPKRLGQIYCGSVCGLKAENNKLHERKRLLLREERKADLVIAEKRLAETDKKRDTANEPIHPDPQQLKPSPATLPTFGGVEAPAGWTEAEDLLA